MSTNEQTSPLQVPFWGAQMLSNRRLVFKKKKKMELCNSQIIFYTFLKAKKKRGFLFNVSFIQNPSSSLFWLYILSPNCPSFLPNQEPIGHQFLQKLGKKSFRWNSFLWIHLQYHCLGEEHFLVWKTSSSCVEGHH